MNLKEKNKLIARFMGMKYGKHRSYYDSKWEHSIASLSKFKPDWNWLLSVVEKIEQLNYYVQIDGLDCRIYSGDGEWSETTLDLVGCTYDVLLERETKLEAVYDSIFEFIQWHTKTIKDGN